MELDGEEHDQVQRPQQVAPDAIGGLVRTDQVGTRQHLVQVHGRQEKQGETRDDLPIPERGVLVVHAARVFTVGTVLPVAAGEFPQRQRRMHDEQRRYRAHQQRDEPVERPAEQVVTFEHARNAPHRVLAEQDRRHEKHVNPHENAQRETRCALQQVEPRGPAIQASRGCLATAASAIRVVPSTVFSQAVTSVGGFGVKRPAAAIRVFRGNDYHSSVYSHRQRLRTKR